jgi:hypothetical protein
MSNISSSAELKEAIQYLELEQKVIGRQLKEQFNIVTDELKPVNLITSVMKDVSSSPYIIDKVVGTALGVGTGYISRKFIYGSSANPVRKLVGSALQLAVTTIATKKLVPVSIMGRFLFKKIFGKKEVKTQKL